MRCKSMDTQTKDTAKTFFPRYPLLDDIAQVPMRIWEEPTFSVREENGRTEFIFGLDFTISDRMQRKFPTFYRHLLGEDHLDFSEFLETGFKQAKYNRRDSDKTLRRVLYTVFAEAFSVMVEEARREQRPFALVIQGEMESFLKLARRDRPVLEQVAHTRAQELALRYSIIKKEVSQLETFVKAIENGKTEEELRAAIMEKFSIRWLSHILNGCAMKKKLPIPGYEDPVDSIKSRYWTVSSLAFGILVCEEEEDSGEPLNARTVRGWVYKGNKIMAQHRQKR